MTISAHDVRGRILVCILVVLLPAAALARPARPAPPLPAPSGTVVNVATEPQLQAAMAGLKSNTTIVLAPGTYVLTRTLYIHGLFNNVGIRGATGNADDVVLVGPGMANAGYGDVPFGIWTGDGVTGVTIANLAIRDFYFHPIIFNGGTQNPRVYNVHLINSGQQFIKVNPDASGVGANNGILEYSVIEYVTNAKDDYTKGIDIQGATNWIIRHNLFRNLVAPPGQIAGPGILAWRGTSHTLVEGNTFLNCARGVMFGADDAISPSHRGGIIRNNFFHRAPGQPGDVGIILSDSPNSQVLNNTLVVSGTYGTPIELRYPGTNGGLVANNLLDGTIGLRDGGSATQTRNYVGAVSTMFVNAAGGDLHLSAAATGAIDQGETLAGVTDDWDGEVRPKGNGYDIGADERGAASIAYQINGRIVRASDGAALAGVAVTLSGARTASTTTDATGRYGFSGLAPNAEYEVTPSKSGYLFTPSSRFFTLGADENGADFTATASTPPPTGGTSATFVKIDASTQGSWRGVYGADGYALANVATSYPAYAQVGIGGASTYTWHGSNADPRAVQRPGGADTDRVAACWFSGTTFSFDVNLTDGLAHRVGLYALDWDSTVRAERIDVVDAGTGAVLDTRTLSSFSAGQHAVWTIAGHVVLRVTSTGAINGVISGLFFDPPSPAPPPPGGGTTTTAAFLRADATTQGSWRGVYGADGYALANVATSYPTYAQVAIGGASTYTWHGSNADPRAVQRPGGTDTDRVAACWFSGTSFSFDVNLTDGAAHTIALYMLDWDSTVRAERIDIVDAMSGVVLDSRAVTSFHNGQYLVWKVTGHVVMKVTSTGAINGVVSGIFFDR